ncbi:MAG: NusG domain II-containing protein [Bacillota bacterium]
MKRFLKLATVSDVLVILVLIGISFLPFAVFYAQQSSSGERFVVITKDQAVLHEIALSDIDEIEQVTIDSDDGHYNTIEISNGEVHMHDANCNDQVCVRSGAIDSPGETIVCLPHKVIVEITTKDNTNDQEIDIISSFIFMKGLHYE